MTYSEWCEHCGSHEDPGHYSEEGTHKAGVEFGWFGSYLGLVQELETTEDGRTLLRKYDLI